MTLVLGPRLDTAAAGPLRQSLRKLIQQAQPLAVDGSAVEQVGQACLQVLMAARTAAAAQGLGFTIQHPSAGLAEAASLAAIDVLDAA